MEGGSALHISVQINKHTPIHTSDAQHTSGEILLPEPCLELWKDRRKINQSHRKSPSLMSFSSVFRETMTRSHGIYNTLPFLHAMFESFNNNKKKQPTMHTLDGTHKNTCEFKATELRKVVPTFPPTLYIICIQGF